MILMDTYLTPRHNIVADISTLGVLGATALHYLPIMGYTAPAVYYSLLSINVLIDWRKRWKTRNKP